MRGHTVGKEIVDDSLSRRIVDRREDGEGDD
jgi:hypothetical protein